MNQHIDNAYQRIDMAMGLIPLGKANALLSEALDELHLAIADTHPEGGDVKQAPLVSGGGAATQQSPETPNPFGTVSKAA